MYKIAIDGPSGSGKSTLAKRLSAHLGFVYVDTGALYRAVGLYVYRAGADPKSSEEVEPLLGKISVGIKYIDGEQKTMLNGEDVSKEIRLPDISMYASAVSALPAVRKFLLGTQKDIIRTNNVIMDGRDIGTVIMPDAHVKIFLISNNETRAMRRCEELLEKGVTTTYEEVLADIVKRDANDSSRAVAPLTPAEDAVFLDNSTFTQDETFATALEIIKNRIDI
ncbi:MAG: (d)CMP kinase [Ruminococcaceae bacterium]|nr:(d)CMP kinase [Oscillospiraceae bacterium]